MATPSGCSPGRFSSVPTAPASGCTPTTDPFPLEDSIPSVLFFRHQYEVAGHGGVPRRRVLPAVVVHRADVVEVVAVQLRDVPVVERLAGRHGGDFVRAGAVGEEAHVVFDGAAVVFDA